MSTFEMTACFCGRAVPEVFDFTFKFCPQWHHREPLLEWKSLEGNVLSTLKMFLWKPLGNICIWVNDIWVTVLAEDIVLALCWKYHRLFYITFGILRLLVMALKFHNYYCLIIKRSMWGHAVLCLTFQYKLFVPHCQSQNHSKHKCSRHRHVWIRNSN